MESLIRYVFIALASVTVIIGLGALATEYINLTITTQQLKNDIEVSLSNACKSFNQESYRSTYLSSIEDSNGNIYIDGNVYEKLSGETVGETYNRIFGYSSGYSKFYSWLSNDNIIANKSGTSIANTYKDLEYLRKGLLHIKNNGGIVGNIDERQSILTGVSMVEQLYTPMNLGVPYVGVVDPQDNAYKAVSNLFKWNITQMWSKCDSSMIINDSSDTYSSRFVQRDGWRVYTLDSEITSIEYKVYDTQSDEDRARLYEEISLAESRYVDTTLDNRYITVIKLGYSVPVGYVGITPWAKIYNYVMSKGVTNNDENKYRYVISNINSTSNGRKDYVYYYNVD